MTTMIATLAPSDQGPQVELGPVLTNPAGKLTRHKFVGDARVTSTGGVTIAWAPVYVCQESGLVRHWGWYAPEGHLGRRTFYDLPTVEGGFIDPEAVPSLRRPIPRFRRTKI